MKKIIDASALRSQKLETFLSASVTNRAVLTDYAAMESFKGDGRVNARKSFEILSKFPKQVIILKSTGEICRLQPRQKGLHNRLIDKHQTNGFPAYSKALFRAQADLNHIDFDLTSKTARAQSHFKKLAASTAVIREGITKHISSYSPDDLKLLRSKNPLPQAIADRMMTNVLETTAILFRDSTLFHRLPSLIEAMHSFQFRYALCAELATLKWITNGGHHTVAENKLQNDYTDMTYAAYATFFDGLLTEDQKLQELYTQAKWLLRHVFP
jgi:hypothetical protein